MKTLLTIGGETYLLPAGSDPAKVLQLFQGMVRTDDRNEWGPDEARYQDDLRLHARVTAPRPLSVKLELVCDEDVITEAEWQQASADRAERERQWRAQQSKPAKALPSGLRSF